jgi:hypothetical protein
LAFSETFQYEGETISSFFRRLLAGYTRANPYGRVTSPEAEQQLVTQAVKGVRQSILALAPKALHCQTLDAVKQEFMAVEAMENLQRGRLPRRPASPRSPHRSPDGRASAEPAKSILKKTLKWDAGVKVMGTSPDNSQTAAPITKSVIEEARAAARSEIHALADTLEHFKQEIKDEVAYLVRRSRPMSPSPDRGRVNSTSPSRNRDVECFQCGKTGHVRRNCPAYVSRYGPAPRPAGAQTVGFEYPPREQNVTAADLRVMQQSDPFASRTRHPLNTLSGKSAGDQSAAVRVVQINALGTRRGPRPHVERRGGHYSTQNIVYAL